MEILEKNNTFRVLEYREKYFNSIEALWRDQYDPEYVEKRKKLFKWLTDNNPFKKNKSSYYLLLDGINVVGMVGHMPLEFNVNGLTKSGRISQDILLDRSYRGKGLGGILINSVTDISKEFSGALWFNEPNFRLYIKNRWNDVPNFYAFLKIFEPLQFVSQRIKSKVLAKMISIFLKALLRLNELRISFEKINNVRIENIREFNSEFDELFSKISKHFGIIVKRNREYLNWKFIQKPYNNYRIYAAYSDDKILSGYIVYKNETSSGFRRSRVVDFLIDPDKIYVLSALVKKITSEIQKENVSYLEVICSNSKFIIELKRQGFIKAQKPLRFTIKNWENYFSKDFICNINNWYITASDADGDAWSVD
jgi:hypothetical protein